MPYITETEYQELVERIIQLEKQLQRNTSHLIAKINKLPTIHTDENMVEMNDSTILNKEPS